MNELQTFSSPEFGEVRTVVIDDEPWFVGKDVAAALGYENPQKALRDHVDNEDKKMGPENGAPSIKDSLGREQYPVFINESGLYSLILSSKLPKAKKFKHWVTAEVLPRIRKTGSYNVKQEQDKTKAMRAAAMLKNAETRQAKLLMEIAAASHIGSYKEMIMAKTANMLAGEELLPMPKSKRERHNLKWYCRKIGKSESWSGQLGKELKKHNIEKKPGENGEYVEDTAQNNRGKQVQNFEWYPEFLLPVLTNLGFKLN